MNPTEVYYQPKLNDEDWGALLWSFEVYRNKDRAKQDFPNYEISTFYNDEIEDHNYID